MGGKVGMVAEYLKAGENCGNSPQFDNAQLDLCTVCWSELSFFLSSSSLFVPRP